MNRRILTTVAIAALALTLGAGFALGAKQKPKNGGFESGDFSHWTVDNLDSFTGNTWYVYSGSSTPLNHHEVPPPPQGSFAATTDGGEGTRLLYRPLKLREGDKHKLKMWVYYVNLNDQFFSPESLDQDGPPNQQYRIDLLRKHAPIDSVDDGDILKRIFATEPGDPLSQAPMKVKVNLSKYAGKKVLLRFAEVDNQFYLHAGVDGVKLKSKPKK